MLLGKVIGHLWATTKCEELHSLRLLLVEPLFSYQLDPDVGYVVAVDNLGAGAGETVIVVFGEPARHICGSSSLPLEAAILTIVDQVDFDSEACSLPLNKNQNILMTRINLNQTDLHQGRTSYNG
ncbi:EutN/CcmL family microcompartment protein [candidate division CSSED10-310 bacterium]|uniref:EutN/CcmL family microcompartment protein n=1 Tax=candidate division CSSED10-310 bacterium TaxID=2855610 RepID=A0ABV6Z225_UNCC1